MDFETFVGQFFQHNPVEIYNLGLFVRQPYVTNYAGDRPALYEKAIECFMVCISYSFQALFDVTIAFHIMFLFDVVITLFKLYLMLQFAFHIMFLLCCNLHFSNFI